MKTCTVKVSEEVLERLKILRDLLNAQDFDEVIWLMTAERPPRTRARNVRKALGGP